MVLIKTEKENAKNLLGLIKAFSSEKDGKIFEKEELMRFIKEEINVNDEFIEKCVSQFKDNGVLYEPKIGYVKLILKNNFF